MSFQEGSTFLRTATSMPLDGSTLTRARRTQGRHPSVPLTIMSTLSSWRPWIIDAIDLREQDVAYEQ